MNTRPVVVAAHSVLGVARGPLDRSDKATRAGRAAVGRYSQIGVSCGTDLDEVTAVRIGPRSGELGAVGFQERLVSAPILRSPDALRALENRAGARGIRIGDDWRVEVRSFRAAGNWP